MTLAAAPLAAGTLDVSAAAAVPTLADCIVRPGESWIYSAGFNVRPDLSDTSRIDCEIADLRRLLDAGARVAILSHQGRHKDGSAVPIGFAAEHLSRRLRRPVGYVEASFGPMAEAAVAALPPGAALLLGNTRLQAGEEADDDGLAAAYARLGSRVAMGGFAKAHRAHASNVGILRHLPGYAADSLMREIRELAFWAGIDPARPSLAVLGGVKQEKVRIGLEGFSRSYDVVIPTGTVLTSCLLALGYDVGASDPGEDAERRIAVARRVLSRRNRARILLPAAVVIARRTAEGWRDARTQPIGKPVPAGHAIVDFVADAALAVAMAEVAAAGGRMLLAGTPGMVRQGFDAGSRACREAFSHPNARAIVVGGDSVADLHFTGTTSTGGGAALQYLVDGDGPVLKALRASAAGAHGGRP